MFKCDGCSTSFNDGAKCDGCDRRFDFGCAQITEIGYRRLGSERRSSWRCPQCKGAASPRSQSTATEANLDPVELDEPVTLSLVLAEIRSVKRELLVLPSLVEDVKSIKQDIVDLKNTCEFNSASLKEHEERLLKVESEISECLRNAQVLEATRKELDTLKRELESKEQTARLNNVEIKGVPFKQSENLFDIADSIGKAVGYCVPKSQINYISRVPMQASKDKLIIISFNNRYIKEDFVAAARAKKFLCVGDISGLQGSDKRIFVNDHLTPTNKKLLTRVKSAAKEKQFKYVWVKYGKIHVRKSDTSNVLIINKDSDLNKLI